MVVEKKIPIRSVSLNPQWFLRPLMLSFYLPIFLFFFNLTSSELWPQCHEETFHRRCELTVSELWPLKHDVTFQRPCDLTASELWPQRTTLSIIQTLEKVLVTTQDLPPPKKKKKVENQAALCSGRLTNFIPLSNFFFLSFFSHCQRPSCVHLTPDNSDRKNCHWSPEQDGYHLSLWRVTSVETWDISSWFLRLPTVYRVREYISSPVEDADGN